jgi:hypothetical protein
VIKAMVKSMDANGATFRVIVAWLQTFVPLGDGVRRIITRILSDDIDHALFFAGLARINEQSAKLLVDLLGSLVNDEYFAVRFAMRLAPVFPDLVRQCLTAGLSPFAAARSPPLVGLLAVLDLSFHFFGDATMTVSIPDRAIDWETLYLGILDIQLEFLRDSGSYQIMERVPAVFWNHLYLNRIVKVAGGLRSEPGRFSAFAEQLALRLRDMEGRESVRLGAGQADPQQVFTGHSRWFESWLVSCRKLLKRADCQEAVVVVLVGWVKEKFVEQSFDRAGVPMEEAIVGGRAGVSVMIALHLLFYCTIRQSQNPRAVLARAFAHHQLDFELGCRALAVLPLRRLIAAIMVNKGHSFGLSDSVVGALGDLLTIPQRSSCSSFSRCARTRTRL